MKTAIYAGSFDPITNGHLDIIKSGSEIFDRLIVAVSSNSQKKSLLSIETRVNLIKESVFDIKNVEVDSFEGLTVEYAKKCGADILLRGLRTASDYEYEMQMAHTNNALDSNIKTVFILSKPEFSYISSSGVREILANNGDISKLVPPAVFSYFNK